MKLLAGVTILLVWIAWTIILAGLGALLGPVGIAVTFPTRFVTEFKWMFGLIALVVLYAPPLVLTGYWWLRRRHAAPPPS